MVKISVIIIIILTICVGVQFRCLNKYRKRDIYLQCLLKNSITGLYFRDTKGNILLANDKFSEMCGIEPDELKGKNIKDLYPEKHLCNIKKQAEQILKNKKTIVFEKAITFLKEDAHIYQILKSPILDNKSGIKGVIVIFRNIDKEKETEAVKETFIATLTHDLKTPTYAQINILKLLLNGEFGELNEQQREMISLMNCSCKYTADLVSTVLDTYRYDNGKINLNPVTFDMNILIRALTKGTEGVAKEKNKKIVFSTKEETNFVYADRLQIKRVIVNLMSNAITYAHPSTTINISLTKKSNVIEFLVMNKSVPISKSEISKIFERYNNTKLSCSNRASTGLGLYISKQIIEMHNGEIFADSSEDGTCTFGFRLPNNINKITEEDSELINDIAVT